MQSQLKDLKGPKRHKRVAADPNTKFANIDSIKEAIPCNVRVLRVSGPCGNTHKFLRTGTESSESDWLVLTDDLTTHFDVARDRRGREGRGTCKGKGDKITTRKGVCSKGQSQYIKVYVYRGDNLDRFGVGSSN